VTAVFDEKHVSVTVLSHSQNKLGKQIKKLHVIFMNKEFTC
jgi:hypothetical protein